MRSQLAPVFKMKEGRGAEVGVEVEVGVTVGAGAGGELEILLQIQSMIMSRSSAPNQQQRKKKFLQVTHLLKRRVGEEGATGPSTGIEELTAAIQVRKKMEVKEEKRRKEGEEETLLPAPLLHQPSVSLKLRHRRQ